MNILIDIGNSCLKWSCESENHISSQTALLHQHSDWQARLLCAWQSLENPKFAIISSVAKSDILLAVIGLLKQRWQQVEIVIPKSQAAGFGVKNAYPQAEKLGVDRWLALIAARHFYPQAAWIIDCGTAITLDFIDSNGVHGGGLIAPGLTLMKKSLLENTAALNFSNQPHELGLANYTEAAIFNGTLLAAIGLIEQAVTAQTATAVLLLTGGDAALIASQLQRPFLIDETLVLKGLSVLSHSL